MGLFRKRGELPPTAEERAGQWMRREALRFWGTVPDDSKIEALFLATDDQLRVLGWDLRNPHQRFLAITEARQRRERPELYRKIQETGALSGEELEEWTAPLREMQSRRVTDKVADQAYNEVFGEQPALGTSNQAGTARVIGSAQLAIQVVRETLETAETMPPAGREISERFAPPGVHAALVDECIICGVEGRARRATYWFVPLFADERGFPASACGEHKNTQLERTRGTKWDRPFSVWIVTRESAGTFVADPA